MGVGTKNPSIDLLKGLLILLVMAGHAMEVAHGQHIILWVGSGFRMPLMVGISGYLLNVARTRAEHPVQILGRYSGRMLLPWLFATIVYVMISGQSFAWAMPLDLLLRPPFHLWYVPVLFFLVMLTRLVPLAPLHLLLIGAPVSIATMYSFGLEHGPMGMSVLAPDSRFVRYLVYFFFGMLMAERGVPRRYLPVALLVTMLGMWWWGALYHSDNGLAYVPARLLMSLGLISLLPSLSALRLHWAPINMIGRDSLFFYLWHPLVMSMLLAAGLNMVAVMVAAVFMLFLASRFAPRGRLIRLTIGSVPIRRAQPEPVPDAQPALASV